MMMIVALFNLSIKVANLDDWRYTIISNPHTGPSLPTRSMNQSFQHFKQAVSFIMSEFELPEEIALEYVLRYMSNEGNTLSLDIAPLAYGTYQ